MAPISTFVARPDPWGGLFCDGRGSRIEMTWSHLLTAGLVAADAAVYELLRIEAGHPRLEREMTLDYIPLEANMWADVSFNKGCYTGQEIIAAWRAAAFWPSSWCACAAQHRLRPAPRSWRREKKRALSLLSPRARRDMRRWGYVKTAGATRQECR